MIAIFPELASCAAARDIERLGILVRMYFGDTQRFAPILDIGAIASEAGLEVVRAEQEPRAALVATDEHGEFRITAILPANIEAAEELRFLIGHQLGHFFLHIQPMIARGDWKTSGFAETIAPLQRYQNEAYSGADAMNDKEKEADDFAAALMMPRAMLKRAIERIGNISKTAKFFGVSVPTLTRRMEQVGLQSDLPKSFVQAETRLGRGGEVEDHAATVEAPTGFSEPLVNKSVIMSSYGQSKRQVEGQLSDRDVNTQPKSPRGMERLREIARRLDRTE